MLIYQIELIHSAAAIPADSSADLAKFDQIGAFNSCNFTSPTGVLAGFGSASRA
jgi:hypothetical protein